MTNDVPELIYLKDYKPSPYQVDTVDLDIDLHPIETVVDSKIKIRPVRTGEPLKLDLDGISPSEVKIDGTILKADEYSIDKKQLVISQVPATPFTLETRTIVDPKTNTQLMGLYMSEGIFCTQCEAEGFRRITPFIDRPDVLARYTTRIEGDKTTCPILLANGNRIDAGDLPNGRHYAVWEDPFPKPAYLFAMVGGKLARIHDSFTTMSGRKVALEIYVEPGKENRCQWAMESLKRSMKWDEEVFGREYDLDIFMIVAVSAFIFGAMENKGLNIFNDSLLLADPDTATDTDYERIEAVIAHEYFHNWTGDRITCRDWFQLCLKEGFTVFRDQEFTSDMYSRSVKRVTDVRRLRMTQFVEDASPLAHPVRPDQYREINNFYTTTIYEKGAELIRMIKILVGEKIFRKGSDLYFERHDGQAVTIEDFIACFAEVSGQDFKQFMRWYTQAGTPLVTVQPSYDEKTGLLTLQFAQEIPATPNQPSKAPHVIPIALGLLSRSGEEMELRDENGKARGQPVLVLNKETQSFKFKVTEHPIPSLLRDFSAPVRLKVPLSDGDLSLLARDDSDAFNRWEASQELALRYLLPMSRTGKAGKTSAEAVATILNALVTNEKLEPAFRALCLSPPSGLDICRELGTNVDPQKVHDAREALLSAIAETLKNSAQTLYADLHIKAAYLPDAEQSGRRALRNSVLKLMTQKADKKWLQLALQQLETASNLTDRIGALAALAQNPGAEREQALQMFEARYKNEPLVLDKWFTVQALYNHPEALKAIEALTSHPVFSFKTPNRVYALLNAFAQNNLSQFHRTDGAGYRYIADCVIKLDPILPSVSARLMTSFRSLSWLDEKLKQAARVEVRRVANTNGLSPDVADLSTRLLAS